MRQLPNPKDSWSEADAMRLIRGLRPVRAPRAAAPARHQELLTRTVEDQVIPQVMAAHRQIRPILATRVLAKPVLAKRVQAKPARGMTAATSKMPSIGRLADLVDLALTGTQEGTAAYLLALRQQGVPVENLLLGLVTQAARSLGEMWEDDTCSFSDVTLGVLRLGHAVRALEEPMAAAQGAPSVMLAPIPAESHGLGLAILAQIFRRAGWRTHEPRARSISELAACVAREHVDIVGLSVACDDHLGSLGAGITSLRQASRNQHLFVLVGGAPFVLNPHLAEIVGADATATDASHAVLQAQRLLAQAARA